MNKNRGDLIRQCDRLCHLLCAHSFLHRCILCGQPGTDPHHWNYPRSILAYRWTLENLVYMCRICHNEVEQNFSKKRLFLKIKLDYPHLWSWREARPPLNSQPISTLGIEWVLEKLQSTAVMLGVKYL